MTGQNGYRPKPLKEMSKQERIALIYRIRVWYPRMKTIYDEIVRAYEMNPVTPDPECVALLGRFRTGKTTIIESFGSNTLESLAQKPLMCPS